MVKIIAEIGINHNGNVNIALELIKKAHEAGVDAVKFQKRNINKIYNKQIINDPNKEFFKISKYISELMNIHFNENKVINAIKSTSFDNMKNLEQKGFFKEHAIADEEKKVKFFNLGPKNDWKKYLNNEIVKEINIKFKNEMEELSYL